MYARIVFLKKDFVCLYASLIRVYAVLIRMYASLIRMYASLTRLYAVLIRMYASLTRLYAVLIRMYASVTRLYGLPELFYGLFGVFCGFASSKNILKERGIFLAFCVTISANFALMKFSPLIGVEVQAMKHSPPTS